jgi:RNA polymerase sigma-70 factor (ECF subfamily)
MYSRNAAKIRLVAGRFKKSYLTLVTFFFPNRHLSAMNPKEFANIIMPIKDKLYRFALRMLRDPAEAEDVVQEVFIKVWDRRNDLDRYRSLEAWCMTLTRNLSIDKTRSRHNKTRDIEESYGLASPTTSPEKQTELNDTMDQLRQIMHELPDNHRVAIHLRDIEGMSYQEISETMDVSLDLVKTYIFRGRQKIKNELLKTEAYGL